MRSTTYSFSVIGDSHEEIIMRAEDKISEYSKPTSPNSLNYEINVEELEEGKGKYKALVTARIKNDNR
jgi:hypothetical protein